MKLTTLILITVILHVSASSLAQKVTLVEKNAPLFDVFQQIRNQTGYDFLFTGSDLKNAKPVTINVKNEELTDALKEIFAGQPLDFAIEDKSVIVKAKQTALIENPKNQLKAELLQVTITGKVQDESGQPMYGVSVHIKGANSGTSTNVKGAYSITVPDEKAIIVFSFIGYETIEMSVRDLQSGNTITLKASITNLKEVIVSKGYYNTTQELNTGNVTRVDGADIAKQPGVDPIQALEGRVAGLYISQTSGIPGSGITVQLRGQNSIAQGNDPLYIIDGVPIPSASLANSNMNSALGRGVNGIGANSLGSNQSGNGMSPFASLDPSNIESIEVLKDADATAIYGSRGANGVILITTKKGKPGQSKVEFNLSQGASRVAKSADLMNTTQYLAMRRQAFANDGLSIPSISTSPNDGNYDIDGAWDQSSNTDWQKIFIGGTAQYTNIQGNMSGGTANTQFLLGGGYNRQTTVFPGNYNDKKGSAHISLTHSSIDQKFRAAFSTQYVSDNSNLPWQDFTSSIFLAPDAPKLYNADGSINWGYLPNGTPTWLNPIRYTLQTANSLTNNLISSFNVGYEIFSGLKLMGNIGYTRMQMNQTNLQPATILFGTPNPNNRTNYSATSNKNTWIFEPQITYSKTIGKGKFDMLVGMTQQETNTNSMSYLAIGFTSDALISNPSFASNFTRNGSNAVAEYRYSAVYSRLNFNWMDKYLLNLTARRDGSSRFGSGREFGNFGAVGGAWIFSKEKWLDGLPWLSLGKLRISYGTTGNDQIGDYQYLKTYAAYSNSYQGVSTLFPTYIGNVSYGWEVNRKLESGLEFSFLKDRLSLNIDYYRNRSSNQLVNYPLPSISGFQSVIANLPAIVQNSGVELMFNATVLKNTVFNWNASINFTVPKNKLISYPNLEASPYSSSFILGKSISSITSVYHYTGVNPQTGIYTIQDINHDGSYDATDLITLENVNTPTCFGGVSNSFTFKDFTLAIDLQFVKQKRPSIYSSRSTPGIFTDNPNQFVSNQNVWSKPGDVAAFQRYTTIGGDANDAFGLFQSSDAAYVDASFIRIKNVQFSYRIPATNLTKIRLQNLRLFFEGQNLLTITKFQGLDPENFSVGLPPLRTFTAGLQIGL